MGGEKWYYPHESLDFNIQYQVLMQVWHFNEKMLFFLHDSNKSFQMYLFGKMHQQTIRFFVLSYIACYSEMSLLLGTVLGNVS